MSEEFTYNLSLIISNEKLDSLLEALAEAGFKYAHVADFSETSKTVSMHVNEEEGNRIKEIYSNIK